MWKRRGLRVIGSSGWSKYPRGGLQGQRGGPWGQEGRAAPLKVASWSTDHVTLTKAWFWNLVWLWGGRVRQRCHVSFGSRASPEIGLQLGQACCSSAGIGRGLVFISAVSSVIHFSSILIYLTLYFSALLLLLSLFSFNKTKTTKYDSDCLSFPWSIST